MDIFARDNEVTDSDDATVLYSHCIRVSRPPLYSASSWR